MIIRPFISLDWILCCLYVGHSQNSAKKFSLKNGHLHLVYTCCQSCQRNKLRSSDSSVQVPLYSTYCLLYLLLCIYVVHVLVEASCDRLIEHHCVCRDLLLKYLERHSPFQGFLLDQYVLLHNVPPYHSIMIYFIIYFIGTGKEKCLRPDVVSLMCPHTWWYSVFFA